MGHYQSIITFNKLPENSDQGRLARWVNECIERRGFKAKSIAYEFVSREKIQHINRHYLKHDYPTDIITFDYSNSNCISGEIFICLDVVKENAADYQVSFQNELSRVIIHGALHLLGFKDRTESEKKEMRTQEDNCLKELDTP